MPSTTVTVIENVASAANHGNVFGLPKMPATPQFVHLMQGDLDNASLNRGRFVNGEPVSSLGAVQPSDYDFTTDPTGVKAQGAEGLTTPYVVGESFTWLFVTQNVSDTTRIFMSNRDNDRGASVYQVGSGSFLDVRFRLSHYDGASGTPTVVDLDASDVVSIGANWRMIAVTYDAATTTMRAVSFSQTNGDLLSEVTLPAGQVFDRRNFDTNTLRLNGDNRGRTGGDSERADYALFAGWDVALTETQLRSEVHPRLKSWLADLGVDVA